jgi:hypothetical protein
LIVYYVIQKTMLKQLLKKQNSVIEILHLHPFGHGGGGSVAKIQQHIFGHGGGESVIKMQHQKIKITMGVEI